MSITKERFTEMLGQILDQEGQFYVFEDLGDDLTLIVDPSETEIRVTLNGQVFDISVKEI
jgi:hypothetical protein